MYRIVVDTNVFISGLLTNGEARRFLLEADKTYTLILSADIINEITEVAHRPKFQRNGASDAIDAVISLSVIVETTSDIRVVRDPDDDMFLNAAKDGHADYIVSNDKDLRDLKKYEGIPIVTVGEMFSLL